MVDHAVSLHGNLRVEVFAENAIGLQFCEGYGFIRVDEYQHEPSGQVAIKMVMP